MIIRLRHIHYLLLTTAAFFFQKPSFAEAENKVYFDFGNSTPFVREDSLFRYIDHPTLASGLVTGARSLNQSVDSLMESLFYNLMDQQFPLAFGDNFSLVTQYERNLHETAFGSYIVVDQFRLGPQYGRILGQFESIPIRLGAETGVDIINITHRSDAARAAEQANLNFWQTALQNWLGILPLLSMILPPSFNPLELYDPIEYLKTPFLFPETAKEAEKLPIGSIRSIGLSGGISVSLDFLEPEIEVIRQELRLSKLRFELPYGVFKTGLHRLHVLRKTEHLYWLAITDQRDIGHKINANLRNNFRIFSELIPIWKGIRAPVFPIDFLLSRAQVKRYDQLFSFDLRVEKSRQAFEEALRGNLIPASELASSDEASGVNKFFNRTTSAFESHQRSTRSIYVQHEDRRQSLSRSLVTINDEQQDHYYLEVEHLLRDTDWNVLVGAERVQFESRLIIKVLQGETIDGETSYVFDPEDSKPYSLLTSISIQDRFLDAREYQQVLDLIHLTTLLPIDESVPQIPIFAADEVQAYYQNHALADPMQRHLLIEPTPIPLGRLYTQTNIHFPYSALQKLAQSDELAIRRAVQAGFSKQSPSESSDDSTLNYWLKRSLGLLLRPFRLLNFRFPYLDSSQEEDRLIEGIERLRQASSPLEVTEAFESILDTAYPTQLFRSLIFLCDIKELSRRVEFTTQSKHSRHDSEDTQKAKNDFAMLDQVTVEAGPPAPQTLTYQYVKEKLDAFTPGRQLFPSLSPRLIGAYLQAIMEASGKPKLGITLIAQPTQARSENLFLYLRLEQGGSVNIGRFVLGERILSLPLAVVEDGNTGEVTFEIRSSVAKQLLTRHFQASLSRDSSYDLYLSVSEDKKHWSQEHLIRFELGKDGKINLL